MMLFWNGGFNPGCICGCCFPLAVKTHKHFCLGAALRWAGHPRFPEESPILGSEEPLLAPRPCNSQRVCPERSVDRAVGIGWLPLGAPGWPILSSINYYSLSLGEVRSTWTALREKRGLLGTPCGLRGIWKPWGPCLGGICDPAESGAGDELTTDIAVCSVSDGSGPVEREPTTTANGCPTSGFN